MTGPASLLTARGARLVGQGTFTARPTDCAGEYEVTVHHDKRTCTFTVCEGTPLSVWRRELGKLEIGVGQRGGRASSGLARELYESVRRLAAGPDVPVIAVAQPLCPDRGPMHYRQAYARAYMPPPPKRKLRKRSPSDKSVPKRPASEIPKRPTAIFVFDWETRDDEAQAPTIGAYRYLRISWRGNKPTFRCVEEGLVAGDSLTGRERLVLDTYARQHYPDVVEEEDTVLGPLRVLTRKQLADKILKLCYEGTAVLCGHHLLFDITRNTVDFDSAESLQSGAERSEQGCEVPRKQSRRNKRAFSAVLATFIHRDTGEERPDRYRPRVRFEIFNSTQASIDYVTPRKSKKRGQPSHWDGHFLDTKRLAFGLSGNQYSLKNACKNYHVRLAPCPSSRQHRHDETCPECEHTSWKALEKSKREAKYGEVTFEHIDYCRMDVAFTAALAEKLLTIHYQHTDIDLHPCQVWSPASYGKAYYDAMGIRSHLGSLDPTIQGYAMAGFHGGRSGVRIRLWLTPIVYCDFTSLYPTVAALLDTWRLVTSSRIDAVEGSPGEAQAWL